MSSARRHDENDHDDHDESFFCDSFFSSVFSWFLVRFVGKQCLAVCFVVLILCVVVSFTEYYSLSLPYNCNLILHSVKRQYISVSSRDMAEFEILFVYFIVSLIGSICMTILHKVWAKVKWNPYRDRDDVLTSILIASYTLRWYV
jgi:glucan phosphoethanolaminetransferase (alkaline phosphatase superfamily)